MTTSGRAKFERYHRILNVCGGILKILPSWALVLLWRTSNLIDGGLGAAFRYCRLIALKCPRLGSAIYIGPNVVIKNPKKLALGSNISIHEFSYIDSYGGIEIGSNVSIAHGCSLLSFEHTWDDQSKPIKYNSSVIRPLRIGNDVWIGAGCRILGGSRISDRVVIAAGAVVKGDLAAGSLYAGVPAKQIKYI